MVHPKGLRNVELNCQSAEIAINESNSLLPQCPERVKRLGILLLLFLCSRYLLAAVSISPLQTFSYFVEWLVVAQLLENVLGAERTRRLFPLMLLVLPAKLLVAGRIVTWSELAGAVLACTCWHFLSGLSGYSKRTTVV